MPANILKKDIVANGDPVLAEAIYRIVSNSGKNFLQNANTYTCDIDSESISILGASSLNLTDAGE